MGSHEEKTFTFINLSHPDDLKDQDTIDHIRCSAMTNFGKTRRKRERNSPKNQIVFEVQSVSDDQSKVKVLSCEGADTFSPLVISPFARDVLTSKFMNNLFRMNTGHSVALREATLSIATRSPLSFQLMLSNSALYGHILQSGCLPTEDTTESLTLYNEALRLMNEKLRDAEQDASDDVIGSMCGFLTHDYILGDASGWNRHMDGLWKMITLRGGFEALSDDQLRVALQWTDICGAFLQDILPHFTMSVAWLKAINAPPLSTPFSTTQPSSISNIWHHELPDTAVWLSIFGSISNLLSDASVPINVWMEPILHRLLSFRPLQVDSIPPRESIIEEVCRIGTLLFLAPLWRTFGVHPVRTATLRQNLLFIIHNYFASWGELRTVLIWVLMHAARESDTEAERSEFVMRVAMVASKMDIQSFELLMDAMKKVLWVSDGGEEEWSAVRVGLHKYCPPEGVQLNCETIMDLYNSSAAYGDDGHHDLVYGSYGDQSSI